jgi:hypothetical protein
MVTVGTLLFVGPADSIRLGAKLLGMEDGGADILVGKDVEGIPEGTKDGIISEGILLEGIKDGDPDGARTGYALLMNALTTTMVLPKPLSSNRAS